MIRLKFISGSIFLRTAFLVSLCSAVVAASPPQLSEPQLIRIADAAARSALQHNLNEFGRRSIQYDIHNSEWTVVYVNVKGGAPSELWVSVSDSTRHPEVIFGDSVHKLHTNVE
jgi:hypothetical protein